MFWFINEVHPRGPVRTGFKDRKQVRVQTGLLGPENHDERS